MSNDYKISVLLPTRGRTDALKRSLISLFNRSIDNSSIQLMLGFDNDDRDSQEYFEKEIEPWLDDKGIDFSILEFDPLGYSRLNEYVNALARASSADWFFFWNDDALMETTGWDRLIVDHTGEFKLLSVHTHRDHPYSIFPIIPKQWLDILGYLSPHPLNDAWTSQIAYKLDIFERIPVYVVHDRNDLTGNNQDETFKARNMNELEGNPNNPKDFHNPSWTVLRMKETEIISIWMKNNGLDITWWENIKLGKQFPWEKLVVNDTNKQMAHFSVNFKNHDSTIKTT